MTRIKVTSRDVFQKGKKEPGSPGGPGEESKPGDRPPVPSTLDDHDPMKDGAPPRRIVKEVSKNAVRAGLKEARSRGMGTLPGNLLRVVEDFLKAKVNWRRALKSWFGDQIKVSYTRTRKRPARRFAHDPKLAYFFPGKKPRRSARVWVAIDNSGSVSTNELRQFFGEIAKVSERVEIILIIWDTSIRQVFKIKSKRQLMEIAKGIGGGGGTMIQVVFDALRQKGDAIAGIPGSKHLKRNPEGIIIFTDGEVLWPEPGSSKGIPTMWAITREEYVGKLAGPKYGRPVYVEVIE